MKTPSGFILDLPFTTRTLGEPNAQTDAKQKDPARAKEGTGALQESRLAGYQLGERQPEKRQTCPHHTFRDKPKKDTNANK